MTVQHNSRDEQNQARESRDTPGTAVVVLAVLAGVLVIAILVAAIVQPLAVIGLPPILFAVAAVVRAAGGTSRRR